MNQPPKIDPEFLGGLELISTKVFPLPGALHRRQGDPDPRLSQLRTIAGIPDSPVIAYYEHIATLRNKKLERFYIAFRQTMDALLIDCRDTTKYPEWLMKSNLKKAELRVHIYQVRMRNGRPVFPADVPALATHEDWLEQIPDTVQFHTLAYFLVNRNVLTPEIYGKI